MFAILDTFNNKIVSRHRTVSAAVEANARFQRAVKRSNGQSSYIPVELRIVSKDGSLERLGEDSQEMEEWLFSEACH
jgi:hypothetical protein